MRKAEVELRAAVDDLLSRGWTMHTFGVSWDARSAECYYCGEHQPLDSERHRERVAIPDAAEPSGYRFVRCPLLRVRELLT